MAGDSVALNDPMDHHQQFARVAVHVAGLRWQYADQAAALETADAFARELIQRVGKLPGRPPVRAAPVASLGRSTLFTLARSHDRCASGWCDARLVGGDLTAYVPGGGYGQPTAPACRGEPGGVEVYAAFVAVKHKLVGGGPLPRPWLTQWGVPAESTLVVRDLCPELRFAANPDGPPAQPEGDRPRLLSWASPSLLPISLAVLAEQAAKLVRALPMGDEP